MMKHIAIGTLLLTTVFLLQPRALHTAYAESTQNPERICASVPTMDAARVTSGYEFLATLQLAPIPATNVDSSAGMDPEGGIPRSENVDLGGNHLAQSLQWCCCSGCCGYSNNCTVIPGCPYC